MSNKYFDWAISAIRFVSRDSARAADVNEALDSVSVGFAGVEADLTSAIKMPPGSPPQQITLGAGLRANKVLGFDAAGNVEAKAFGGNWRGDWAAGQTYGPGDIFVDPATGNLYSTIKAHTATTIAADLASGNIVKAIDVASVQAAKTAAAASASAAATSATAAASSATAADASKTSADASATSANASAAAASGSASAAATATADAQYASALSANWATKLGGEVITGQGYSSRQYAQNAAQSASDAAAATGIPATAGKAGKVLQVVGSNPVWVYPEFPTKGQTAVTLNRTGGVLTSVNFTLDGSAGTITMTRTGGVLTQVATTYGGKTRTETLTYTAGVLTSIAATET